MQSALLPVNEEQRLKELYSLDLLDTDAETDFDELVQIASYICQSTISLMSVIDKDRQWFKAKKGLADTETPREVSFCAHAILEKGVFIVEDALNDERFQDNPYVISGLVRFYAGAPIQSENNFPLGTICVIDSKPMKLTTEQSAALKGLARQASVLIELKSKNKLLKKLALEQLLLKEKAERASKAHEQFLSTMSHEIRTPLNGVMGIIHLLSQNSPREDQVQDIEFLKISSENLLHIVNDILDYNKIETGNLKIEKTQFNLREVIFGIEKIHRLAAEQKGIRFSAFIDPSVPDTLTGDPMRIKQVLNNLTSNAIKFTEKGFVELQVSLCDDDSSETSLFFKVTDTGIGINADKVNSIYDRFFQADSNTTRIYGGTGLGLAISKKILQLMNSEIKVQSGVGTGSCFSFIIPFDKVTQGTVTISSKNCLNAEEGKLYGLNILVVEDNKMNKILIEKFLKKWKVNADFAMNGAEAIDLAAKKDYHLVLMDLQMPVMDGYEATEYIRQKLKKDMPIIAMTADVFFNSDNNINKCGLTDYVLKPFDPKNLYNKICSYTGKE